MAENRRMDGNQWRAYILAAVIGLLSGGGGAWTLGQTTDVLRSDPFTSKDWTNRSRDLRLEMENKIKEEQRAREKLEERVRELEQWVSNHRKRTLKH